MRDENVALFGASGFVGSAIYKALMRKGLKVHRFDRANFKEAFDGDYEYAINTATPSARYKASKEPEWDFDETVLKSARIYYGVKWKKFIQISSLSARCQLDTIYGRHKLAAEQVVDKTKNAIFRLGPMYGPGLKKGVLEDMINGSQVYLSGESRYCFCSVEFVGAWISENLYRTGIVEVGAKNSISLEVLARKLGLDIKFQGVIDHQEIVTSTADVFPDAREVIEFMRHKGGLDNDR